MATRTITTVLRRANGSPWGNATVRVRLLDDTYTIGPAASYPIATVKETSADDGSLTLELEAGLSSLYEVTLPDGQCFLIGVPPGDATTLEELREAYNGTPPPAPPDVFGSVAGFVLAVIDTPLAQATIDHANLQNIGVNTHAQIDAHIAATADVHGVDGNLVGTNGEQILQNKILGPGTAVALGADAAGDLYYRDADGDLVRLPIGSAGQILKVADGLPGWGDELISVDPQKPLYASPSVSSAIANTNSETAFNRFYTVPGNTVAIGDVFRLTAWINHATGTSGATVRFRLRWGGVSGVLLADSGVIALSTSGAFSTLIEALFQFEAIGAVGSAVVMGTWGVTPAQFGILVPPANPVASLPTTSSKDLVLTVQHGAALSAATATLRGLLVEKFTP